VGEQEAMGRYHGSMASLKIDRLKEDTKERRKMKQSGRKRKQSG